MPASNQCGFPGVCRIPFDGPAKALPARELVGSKAHHLMRIARCGLPVPPGFVFPSQLCRDYLRHGPAALEGIDEILVRELDHLGTLTGRGFGDARRPLLVSVRSGAAVSMPGMMETVLNLGLTEGTLRGLVRMTGNPRLARDCRRRLIQQYGEVVHGIAAAHFDQRASDLLDARALPDVTELDTDGLRELAVAFEQEFEARTGGNFPGDPLAQLRAAIEAVLRSWSSERARIYRQLNGIPDDLGTAATVQAMVFGNLGPDSGSGVGFTRNPATGENELYGDYLANAQGEDVVAGRRRTSGLDELLRRTPQAYQALAGARGVLEREFSDMQDFEFTVEEGRLIFLQSRAGKRTGLAALRIARDMVREKLIRPSEALARLAGIRLDEIEETSLAPPPGVAPAARGTPAGIGVAVGVVAFDPLRIAALKRAGQAVILVRQTAEAGDLAALAEAAALVTVEGARTSHAAVVARQLEKPCIVACGGFSIDPSARRGTLGGEVIREGDAVSLDGSTGEVFRGEIQVISARPTALLEEIRRWHVRLREKGAGRKGQSPRKTPPPHP